MNPINTPINYAPRYATAVAIGDLLAAIALAFLAPVAINCLFKLIGA